MSKKGKEENAQNTFPEFLKINAFIRVCERVCIRMYVHVCMYVCKCMYGVSIYVYV